MADHARTASRRSFAARAGRLSMLVVASGVLAALPACASGGASGDASASRNVITAEQLSDMPQGSAYDAVQRLRPRWLQGRGISSVRSGAPELAQVYLDGAPMGGLRALHNITINQVEEIRYLDGRDATTRFGTGHGGGAILVSTGTSGSG